MGTLPLTSLTVDLGTEHGRCSPNDGNKDALFGRREKDNQEEDPYPSAGLALHPDLAVCSRTLPTIRWAACP